MMLATSLIGPLPDAFGQTAPPLPTQVHELETKSDGSTVKIPNPEAELPPELTIWKL